MLSDYICFFKLLPSYWVYCYAVVIVVCHVAAVFTLLINKMPSYPLGRAITFLQKYLHTKWF